MSGKSKSKETEQELTIEEAFEQIEEILEQMSEGDPTLEESFRLYEKGMKLVKSCSLKIDMVEKKVKKLDAEGGVEDFDV